MRRGSFLNWEMKINFILRYHYTFIRTYKIKKTDGTSLAVQWLRFQASTAGGVGSIPGSETKIPHAMGWGQK